MAAVNNKQVLLLSSLYGFSRQLQPHYIVGNYDYETIITLLQVTIMCAYVILHHLPDHIQYSYTLLIYCH